MVLFVELLDVLFVLFGVDEEPDVGGGFCVDAVDVVVVLIVDAASAGGAPQRLTTTESDSMLRGHKSTTTGNGVRLICVLAPCSSLESNETEIARFCELSLLLEGRLLEKNEEPLA